MKAIELAGGQTDLARKIGVSPQVVNNWVRRGNVPADYCPSIERVLEGQVTCEQLRPDVDWAYLRKTCKGEAQDLGPEVVARSCCERRNDDRRSTADSFGEFGERRGPDRRDDDRRTTCADESAV